MPINMFLLYALDMTRVMPDCCAIHDVHNSGVLCDGRHWDEHLKS